MAFSPETTTMTESPFCNIRSDDASEIWASFYHFPLLTRYERREPRVFRAFYFYRPILMLLLFFSFVS